MRKAFLFRVVQLATAIVALGSGTLPVHAQQSFPSQPIKMLVGFTPGGSTDVIARIVSEGLSNRLGTSVVVENRAGASGNLSAGLVARAAPDGHTLYMGAVGLATTAAVNPAMLQADPVKDFTHIAMVAFTPNVLVVGKKHDFQSVNDLIAYAKKNPGKLSFGSSGIGGGLHLTGEMFKVFTNIDIVHVPYKGIPLAITDLMGGHLDMLFDNVSTSLPHIRDGSLRALAVTSRERLPDLPNVPTMIESGLKDLEAGAWFGVMGPAGISPEIVQLLATHIAAILDDPKTTERFQKLSITVLRTKSPREFKEYVAHDIARWKRVVQAAGVKPQ